MNNDGKELKRILPTIKFDGTANGEENYDMKLS
jgi:hypothetical protein